MTNFEKALEMAHNCGAEAARQYNCPVPEWYGEPVLPRDWDVIEEALGMDPSNMDSVANQELIDFWLDGYNSTRERINA